jgi:hypothetical protein
VQVACLKLERKDGSDQPIYGTTRVPIVGGVAAYSDISINTADVGYRLHFGVFQGGGDGDPCGNFSQAFAEVTSNPFNVSFSYSDQLAMIQQPLATIAGVQLSQLPKIAFQDPQDNIVTVANCPGNAAHRKQCQLQAFVQVALIMLPPGALSSAINQKVYHMCRAPPLFQCVEEDAIPEAPVNGEVQFTELVLRRMGTYKLRFYSEGLSIDSHMFYVASAGAYNIRTISSPMTSTCKTTELRHCKHGGVLTPQPSFSVWDEFGNLAMDGEHRFVL